MERLCEILRRLGNSLDLAETLSTLDSELSRSVRYDAISVHLADDRRLTSAYAAGAGFQSLASLEPGIGEGLLGAVAATGRPAFNGHPEFANGLVMALGVGIELHGRITGVLTLYRIEPLPFAAVDLRLLEALSPKLAASIDNAQRFGRAERACARALFERLDAEVARARRTASRLAVLECTARCREHDLADAERIAGEVRRMCREYDFVARSGNSLVVVLADFAPADLAEKVARIEAVFRRAGLAVSIGAAFLPEDGADAEDLLAAAHGAAHA